MVQMPDRRKMKLGVFLYPTGHHLAAWRHPDTQVDAGLNFAHYAEIAQTAERGKLDMLFLADTVGARDSGDLASWSLTPKYTGQFEPLTLLSALSVVTDRIGLVATATTTYNEPYHIARKFASLDHLSKGRAGWNLVTSSSPVEAFNFGRDEHVPHGERYKRAREFAEVVRGLWDTWEDDAFLFDRESGRYFDPAKVHFLHHQGEHFKVRGPLNVARPPQGYPVVVQAGSSEAGKELAAETAEVVFAAQQTLKEAQAFYADLKGRLPKFGRSPDDLKILPGVFAVAGRTEAEAVEKFEELQALVHPVLGLSLVSDMLGGVDLSGYDLDAPFPETIPESNGGKGRADLIRELARREKLTLRQTYLRIAGARGHWTIVGSAEQIADQLEHRFLEQGADGFNIMPAALPQSLDDFVNLVVPELQRRGLFRTEYESSTLRGNLGLKRPPHPAARRSAATTQALANLAD
jgi:FMN-dependent oxidoreductase (nitrilotriacetate monooxygenase family)